ncbi:MAG: right-handed parallel beta-helix repeat-containing protein [Spirochaetes bacterium]|nr:right-handed parallel beta-helix repeat-containing protein [Spirochaetota bacterium]
MKKGIILCLIILFGTTFPSYAIIYYVCKSGCSTNTNINVVLPKLIRGDTIEIQDNGIYHQAIPLIIISNDITIRGKEGFRPTIYYGDGVVSIFATNVTLKNLEIHMGTPAMSYPVLYIKGWNNVVDNCRITANGNMGANVGISLAHGSFSNIIKNCDIGDYLTSGIVLSNGAQDNEIFKNDIHDLTYGIQVLSADYNDIYQNYLHELDEIGIYLETSSRVDMFYNLIVNCHSYGITNDDSSDINIFNNTIVKNNVGIGSYFFSSYYHYYKNNIVYNNAISDFSINSTAMDAHMNIENCCFLTLRQNGNIYTHLDFNTKQDPHFVNYAGNDFNLYPPSPCIDTAQHINYLQDYGVDIPVYNYARDMGALEYQPVSPPAAMQSRYIRLSANKFTKGQTTTIYIANIEKLAASPDEDDEENGHHDDHREFFEYESTPDVYLKLVIFDIRGKIIKNIYEGNISSVVVPSFNWDGKDNDGEYVGAGLYVVKARINNVHTTAKLFFVP